MATIRLRRQRNLIGLIVPFRIDIGMTRVATLWAGQSITLDVAPGPHRLTVWSGKIRVGQETVRATDASSGEYLIAAEPQHQRLAILTLGFIGAGRGSVSVVMV